ncbi:MAG: EF-hand domain-containing protein [Pseudomonadota bacterium]
MKKRRPSKKTESIEIRVSPEQKAALHDLSMGRGLSMSETVRGLVERELMRPAETPLQTGDPFMAQIARSRTARFGLGFASIFALAVAYSLTVQSPAAASVSAEARMTFAEIDANGDNLLTPEEYAAQITRERAEEPPESRVVPAACAGTFIEDDFAEEAAAMSLPAAQVAQDEFDFLDSDQDGAVSFEELEAFLLAERARDFLEFDEDGNGFVTLAEVTLRLNGETRAEEAAFLAEEGLSDACIDAILADWEDGGAAENPRQVLAEFDINRDGRVGLVEYLEH